MNCTPLMQVTGRNDDVIARNMCASAWSSEIDSEQIIVGNKLKYVSKLYCLFILLNTFFYYFENKTT